MHPRFETRFMDALPSDPLTENYRRQVRNACYSRVQPTQVAEPKLVAYAPEVAELIGFSEAFCEAPEFAEIMSGNALLDGMAPYAACYGGHQFGHWAGQLGDGRAITLGEARHPETGDRWELQLKGAGPTPYSRRADGRAVLRSSIREFLCSEAMHHLGVPTTRALSLVLTGEEVVRDMFYDGNPRAEPGAVVCRVAPSFLRFGSYEIHTSRGDIDTLRKLTDFTIEHYFPELLPSSKSSGERGPEVYAAWLAEVSRRTAFLISEWMRVGFVHGVMNTDNLSILGLTIDYGPYGWLEDFDPNWTPNTTDAQGRRYRFAQQPVIAHWNLVQLANAIYPLVEDKALLEEALQTYPEAFSRHQAHAMARKLGLEQLEGSEDESLVNDVFVLLERVETDMTLFFRHLADLPCQGVDLDGRDMGKLSEPLQTAYYRPEALNEEDMRATVSWLSRYVRRVQQDGTSDAARRARMNAANPLYVLRNYLAQEAIDLAEEGDYTRVHELLEVMRQPYREQPGQERFAQKRPEWARHRPGCSMLSCSS